MKRQMVVLATIILLCIAVFPFTTNAQVRVGVGLGLGFGGPNSFYVELENYYHVPYREIYAMHLAGICDNDIPVVLFIHARSHYSLRQIYAYRLRGMAWDRIFAWSGVPARMYNHDRFAWRGGHFNGAIGRFERNDGARFAHNGASGKFENHAGKARGSNREHGGGRSLR